jgi:hypothetical protein
MLYVRKGLFEGGSVASADELNREFNRAADSISKIDHMMILEGTVGKLNFLKPYESTRAPSATHLVTYAEPPATPASSVLYSASAVGAPTLMDLNDAGINAWANALTAAGNPLEVNIRLADIADVLISISCQYFNDGSVLGPPVYLSVSLQSLVNGTGGVTRTFGNHVGPIIGKYIGLSLMNTVRLPAGDHTISARVRSRASEGVATEDKGEVRAMSIFAAGLYR